MGSVRARAPRRTGYHGGVVRSLLPILLVVACRQPEPEPACLFEVDGWFDSPARHVVYAGAGGDFGYATQAEEVAGESSRKRSAKKVSSPTRKRRG